MARAGLCSRRDAEGWIAAGRVAVNGAVHRQPGPQRRPGRPRSRSTASRCPSASGPACSCSTSRAASSPRRATPRAGRRSSTPCPRTCPASSSIGRLDINTEGLLLLTNDGGLARVLELPATGWLRRYRVRANGEIDQAAARRAGDGITIDGVDYAGIEATLDRVQGANVWLTMGLREGKNREIKRVLEHLGLAVNRLIRISFGPFQLGELAEGAVERCRPACCATSSARRWPPRPASTSTSGARRRAGPAAAARPEASTDAGRPAPLRPPRAHMSALRAAREEAARRRPAAHRARRHGGPQGTRRQGRARHPGRAGAARDGDSRNARRFAAGTRTAAGARRPAPMPAAGPSAPARRQAPPSGFGEATALSCDARRQVPATRGSARRARVERQALRPDRSPGRRSARRKSGQTPRRERHAGRRGQAPWRRAAGSGRRTPPRRPAGGVRRETPSRTPGGSGADTAASARRLRRQARGASPSATKPRGERAAESSDEPAGRSPRPSSGSPQGRRGADTAEGGDGRSDGRGGSARTGWPARGAGDGRDGKPERPAGRLKLRRPATGRNKPRGRPGGARPAGGRPDGRPARAAAARRRRQGRAAARAARRPPRGRSVRIVGGRFRGRPCGAPPPMRRARPPTACARPCSTCWRIATAIL